MRIVGGARTLDKITPYDIERWKHTRVKEVHRQS